MIGAIHNAFQPASVNNQSAPIITAVTIHQNDEFWVGVVGWIWFVVVSVTYWVELSCVRDAVGCGVTGTEAFGCGTADVSTFVGVTDGNGAELSCVRDVAGCDVTGTDAFGCGTADVFPVDGVTERRISLMSVLRISSIRVSDCAKSRRFHFGLSMPHPGTNSPSFVRYAPSLSIIKTIPWVCGMVIESPVCGLMKLSQ